MDYKKQGHCVYYARYHLVMATKYRRKILKGGFGEYLKNIMIGIGKQIPEIEVIQVNTNIDHVHILLSIPPKLSISEVVKMLKAKNRLAYASKVSLFGQSLLGSRRYLVAWLFRINCWHKRVNNKEIY